jgi:hypothetical protein
MPDTDLLLSMAEIAGVFVGFGALIAVRNAGAGGQPYIAPVRGVVMLGIVTIVAALAPITLSRYELAEQKVLAFSSVLVLVSYGGLAFIHIRAPEYSTTVAATSGGRFELIGNIASVAIIVAPAAALVVIAIGIVPGLEAALYFTVVVLVLVQASWALLWLVFDPRLAGQ